MFGLDMKSFIVGALFAYFALPFIMGLIGRVTSPAQPTNA